MALLTFLDTFNIGTGAVGTTVVRTGYGFQPKCCLLMCNGRTESVNAVGGGHHQRSFGMVVSASSQHVLATHSENGVATADADYQHNGTECLRILTTAGANAGACAVQSMDAGGITFEILTQFTTSVRVAVLAFGGSDITAVALNTFDTPTIIGTQDVDIGFSASVIFFFGTFATGSGVQADSRYSIGYIVMDTLIQGVLTGGSNDGVATKQTAHLCTGATCCTLIGAALNSVAVIGECQGEVVANNFRINWTDVDSVSRRFAYLAIQGGSWHGTSFTTRTDGTAFGLSGFGHAPAGLVFVSAGGIDQGSLGEDPQDISSVGFATSASARVCMAVSDQDNLATSEVATAIRTDAVYARPDLADGLEGLMDIQSIDANGVTLVMDDADPDAAFGWVVSGGSMVQSTIPALTMAPYRPLKKYT